MNQVQTVSVNELLSETELIKQLHKTFVKIFVQRQHDKMLN